jgi:UDP-glucose 4-epimerase
VFFCYDCGMKILVTGGAGYIGAHTVRQLVAAGHEVAVVDNLSTGTKQNLPKGVQFIKGDFGAPKVLRKLFDVSASTEPFEVVMHFAASLNFAESVEKPLEYFENNTLKTGALLNAMLKAGINKIVFSSTAAVYGAQKIMPIPETAVGADLSPYGASKLLCEKMLEAYCDAAGLNAVVFRYFNACGSDVDKQIFPMKTASLFSQIAAVASGETKELTIFGASYDTIDGTGVRDYIHVVDIARAHVAALNLLQNETRGSFRLYNIGTGTGWSVKQVLSAAVRILGKEIPVRIFPPRPGEVSIAVADNSKIRSALGFEPEHSDLETLIKSSCR